MIYDCIIDHIIEAITDKFNDITIIRKSKFDTRSAWFYYHDDDNCEICCAWIDDDVIIVSNIEAVQNVQWELCDINMLDEVTNYIIGYIAEFKRCYKLGYDA